MSNENAISKWQIVFHIKRLKNSQLQMDIFCHFKFCHNIRNGFFWDYKTGTTKRKCSHTCDAAAARGFPGSQGQCWSGMTHHSHQAVSLAQWDCFPWIFNKNNKTISILLPFYFLLTSSLFPGFGIGISIGAKTIFEVKRNLYSFFYKTENLGNTPTPWLMLLFGSWKKSC